MDSISLCLIAPEFLPVWGGTGSYVVELLKYLPKDVDVHVVTLKRRMPGMSENDLAQNDPKLVCKRDMTIHYISNAEETFFYNLGFQIACFREIPKLNKDFKFDVLHSQFGHMSDIFLQLVKKVRTPNVATVHGTLALLKEVATKVSASFSELEWSEKQVRLFYPALRTLELLYAKRVSQFIAVSDVTKQRIIKDLGVEPERIHTIFNGVDTKLFCVPSESEAEKRYSMPTVVYMGRMMAKKGIHVLIKAMPRILDKKPDTRFLFVGGGQLLFYREMVRKMGIPEENYSFVGHVGYYERAKILREASIFVNPSFFELCSLSILEAMSCGVSVVASNVGGNPEMIEKGKNGLLVPPNDHVTLARCIISLFEDENLNKMIGREARKTVEELFSSERCAEETCNVYKKIVDGKC